MRGDTNPGCWLNDNLGYVALSDFGDVRFNGMNCLEAWKIWNSDRPIPLSPSSKREASHRKTSTTVITPKSREWDNRDELFWGALHIPKYQLIEDKVKPTIGFEVNSGRYNAYYSCIGVGYAYTDFPDGRCKIYQPYNKEVKWKSTTKPEDIGFFDRIVKEHDVLCICKSYCDARINANIIDYVDTVWIQAEGNNIHDKLLSTHHSTIALFMDNDIAGTQYLIKHIEQLSTTGKRIIPIQLPLSFAKDNKDAMQRHGFKHTKHLLKKLFEKRLCQDKFYSILSK